MIYQSDFFKKTSSLEGNKKQFIQDLMKQVSDFKAAFENELKRAVPKNGKEELEAAIARSNLHLDTLVKMDQDLPVSVENLNLLVEYIEVTKPHFTQANQSYLIQEIKNYLHIENKPTPS